VPFAAAAGVRIRYELAGPERAPVVVLSHSLGADLAMWDPQARALAERFRVLRYDSRGHGESAVPPAPWSLEAVARDVLALLDALGLERVHFCGLSMGGLVGMWLGANAAERVERLVLCSTAAKIGSDESWSARIQSVDEGGMAAVSQAIVERWFTPAFRDKAPEVVARTKAQLERTPASGYTRTCAAIRDADCRPGLSAISAPTLVVSGRADPATPPAEGQAIARAVRGARYVELEASHLANLEAEAAFTAALSGFLAGERSA
jgi:3-oxoadipate enol-lactonase